MIWTIALVGTTGLGTILAAHSWRGWALMAASEILWAIYAETIRSTPLLIMAVIWFGINCRNTWVTSRHV